MWITPAENRCYMQVSAHIWGYAPSKPLDSASRSVFKMNPGYASSYKAIPRINLGSAAQSLTSQK
jgi:hypothetical protein